MEVLEVLVPVELIEDQKQASLELINDLKAAVEANSSKGRSVLYPGKSMKFDVMPPEVVHSQLVEKAEWAAWRPFLTKIFLRLGRIAGVAGHLPHCSARELPHSSSALPRSWLPLLLRLN